MRVEEMTLNAERNVVLTGYIQDVEGEFTNIIKRPAVLIIPGGGYKICSQRESEPVVFEFLKAGFHAFVLRYSVQEHAVWPNPLLDYETAMRLIRDRAEEWKLYSDKIAVIGFSAGGHLAAAAAVMAENRPNAAVLGYPVINESSARVWEKTAPDILQAVDKNTCPCFLFATRTDGIVPVENTIQLMDALNRNGISFESHIYSYGPHGFSTAADAVRKPGETMCGRVSHWVQDSVEWLQELFGTFGEKEMTSSTCEVRVNCDEEDTLSSGCSVGKLTAYPQAYSVIEQLISRRNQELQECGGMQITMEQLKTMMPNVAVKEGVLFETLTEEERKEIDGILKKIKCCRQ